MQEITPYYRNDSPRYIVRKKSRKIYFRRIAVLFILLFLCAAAILWFISRVPDRLVLGEHTLYLTGEASAEPITNNEQEYRAYFTSLNSDNFAVLDAEFYGVQYFMAQRVFSTKEEAESSALISAENGLRQTVVRFNSGQITIQADKDSVNNVISQRLFNGMLKLIEDLNSLNSEVSKREISEELFSLRINSLYNNCLTNVNDAVGLDGIGSFIYFYSSVLQIIEDIRYTPYASIHSKLNNGILKAAQSLFTAISFLK